MPLVRAMRLGVRARSPLPPNVGDSGGADMLAASVLSADVLVLPNAITAPPGRRERGLPTPRGGEGGAPPGGGVGTRPAPPGPLGTDPVVAGRKPANGFGPAHDLARKSPSSLSLSVSGASGIVLVLPLFAHRPRKPAILGDVDS